MNEVTLSLTLSGVDAKSKHPVDDAKSSPNLSDAKSNSFVLEAS